MTTIVCNLGSFVTLIALFGEMSKKKKKKEKKIKKKKKKKIFKCYQKKIPINLLRDYFVTKVASINWDVREHFF
jgi:hypothetical protein